MNECCASSHSLKQVRLCSNRSNDFMCTGDIFVQAFKTYPSDGRFQHATENRELLEVASFAGEVFDVCGRKRFAGETASSDTLINIPDVRCVILTCRIKLSSPLICC